ncbi:MAG: N-acetyltransferase [Ruminococcus sp.]|nr:N-acetyltransferase [Ruminococcus sp.]
MNFIFEPNRIFYQVDGKLLAEITFPQTQKGVFCIDHTFVDSSLRGQGIANKLVELAVKQILNQNGRVVATCSYAQKWLHEHGQEL